MNPSTTAANSSDMEFNQTLSFPSDAASTSAQGLIMTGNTKYPANNYPLYLATMKCDWERVKQIIEHNPNAHKEKIGYGGMTALMVAAREGNSEFIEKLLETMSPEEVGMQDDSGNTALHLYAANGNNIKTVEAFLRKNATLTQMISSEGFVPLHVSCFSFGTIDMVWYLTLVTTDEDPGRPFTGPRAGSLVSGLTCSGFHDVTLYLIQRYPSMAMARSENSMDIISSLAQRFADFPSGTKLGFWERCLYRCITTTELVPLPPKHSMKHAISLGHTKNVTNFPSSTQLKTYGPRAAKGFSWLLRAAIETIIPGLKNVRETKIRQKCAIALVKIVCERLSTVDNQEVIRYFSTSALAEATYYGVVEIIAICLQQFPELIWFPLAREQNLLKYCIYHRQDKIYNTIKSMNTFRLIANYYDPATNTTVLHLTASMAPTSRLLSVSGTALQMQRELQWFKEVESLLLPGRKMMRTNRENKSAQEIFTEQHKELVEKGEKWMKDTSTSCMVVATLIATVLFAAAFTVPGGNTSDQGIPIYLRENIFMVFVVSDTVGLLSSLTSVLMFLSILTARYAEQDFLKSLPQKLIIGFASLFCAIAAMMVAFGSALSIVLDKKLRGGTIPITLLATFPVTMFAMLQLPLFIQMIQSTYGAGIFKLQRIL